ncbi:MAG: phage head closure protein [Planctomycetota bacterium]
MRPCRSRRHRVTFERENRQGGDFGDGTVSWDAIEKNVPASIKPLTGRELIVAQQVQSQLTHRITIRWSEAMAKVTTKDRIKYGDRVFNIISRANVDERNIALEFMCTEQT